MENRRIFFYKKNSAILKPIVNAIVGQYSGLVFIDTEVASSLPRWLPQNEPALVIGDLVYLREHLRSYITKNLITLSENDAYPWADDSPCVLLNQWISIMKRMGFSSEIEKLSSMDSVRTLNKISFGCERKKT